MLFRSSDIPPHEAASIAELATQISVPAEELERTIAEFNAACPSEPEGAFNPFAPDFRATRGLAVPKSHWARPIDKGPYRAFPVVASNCFTFGGLKVSANGQVIDQDGRIMHGLYAAGETMGIYHNVYTGSTSVLRGLVFGRRAASHVASELRAR